MSVSVQFAPAWAILGGFGIFIFGIRFFSDALQRLAGPRFKRLLDRAAGNRCSSILLGGVLTSLFHSEAMAAILTVSLTNSGLLSFYQALGVFLGTTLGTFVAIQTIGFQSSQVTFSLIAIGVSAKYFSRSRRIVIWGDLLFAIGLVFLGLLIIESGFSGIVSAFESRGMFAILSHSRPSAFLAGLISVVFLQSGQAALVMVASLLKNGLIDLNAAGSMIAGELLGAPLMALVASLLGTTAARRAAVVFFCFNMTIALLAIFLPSELMALAGKVSSDEIRQLAMAHTLLTALAALLFTPLLGSITRLVDHLTNRNDTARDLEPRAKFLDHRILSTPGLAIHQLQGEIARMSQITSDMLNNLNSLLYRYDPRLVQTIRQQEEMLDLLQQEITMFMTRLAPSITDPESRARLPELFITVNNLEQVGDRGAMFLNALTRKKERRIIFSQPAMNDLKLILAEVQTYFDTVLQYWDDRGKIPVDSVKHLRQSVAVLVHDANSAHLERLADGKCTVEGGLIYNDLLEACDRMSENIASLAGMSRRG